MELSAFSECFLLLNSCYYDSFDYESDLVSIDLTPNLLVFTHFMHDQVNNRIDIMIFFCPLLFCIIKQAQIPPPRKNSGIDLSLAGF